MSDSAIIACMLASFGISFLMSGMEAGVFAMSRLRIRHAVRSGNPSAAALLAFLEHPEHFLWTILVGNTLATLSAVSLLVLWLDDLPVVGQHRSAYWAAVGAGAVMFYALADLLPKMLFRTFPNRLCLAMAIPFRAMFWLLRPLVLGVEFFAGLLLKLTGGGRFTGHLFGNRDELRLLMQETGQSLSSEERTMINRVLDLQNRLVGEIAIPIGQAAVIAGEEPVSRLLEMRRERGFSRYPVTRMDRTGPRVVGYVNSERVLYEESLDPAKPVADFLKPALFLDAGMRLDAALRQMQRSGQRMAIVLGPDRQEMGIIGLADILKAIFGEVRL